jgi:hypothetical protein
LLPDVMLDKGVLKITPIEKSTPPQAEAVAARLYAMLPRIRITDLLSEFVRLCVKSGRCVTSGQKQVWRLKGVVRYN